MDLNLLKRREFIKDKVCLVTGGGAGIGANVVRNLLADDASHVAFLDVAEREGAALENELLNNFGGLRAKFIKCDISDEAQLSAAYKQVFDKYRRLDIVINNAAVLSANENFYKRMVDVNFTGTVSSTMKALNLMGVDKGGSGGTIVNISSLLALKPNSHLPVYAATKNAVLHFSTSLGSEELYTKSQVRIITVCLGPTDTAFLHRQNFGNNDKDSSQCLTSRAPVRQRVESAAVGIIEALVSGINGSIMVVANDKPPVAISRHIDLLLDYDLHMK